MEEGLAEGRLAAVAQDSGQFATKADLTAGLAELETRLVREIVNRDWRMVGAVFAIVGVAVALLKLVP